MRHGEYRLSRAERRHDMVTRDSRLVVSGSGLNNRISPGPACVAVDTALGSGVRTAAEEAIMWREENYKSILDIWEQFEKYRFVEFPLNIIGGIRHSFSLFCL